MAVTTGLNAWPRMSGPHEPTYSMYSLASKSQRYAPTPRTMIGGSPPTDLNARTGEFTPPGITFSARCWALRERVRVRGMKVYCNSPDCFSNCERGDEDRIKRSQLLHPLHFSHANDL